MAWRSCCKAPSLPPATGPHQSVAAFFYANGIAFYASRSLEFREMVAAIARQGAAYTAPKYDALRTTLLDREGVGLLGQGAQGGLH